MSKQKQLREKHYQKMGVDTGRGVREGKINMSTSGGGRTDFIFLTHWDRFQQITDKQVKKSIL